MVNWKKLPNIRLHGAKAPGKRKHFKGRLVSDPRTFPGDSQCRWVRREEGRCVVEFRAVLS